MKFKIIELPQFVGKTLQEVKDFVEKEYPGQLAKEEHREEFIKSNPKLPDWTWCFFFGSKVRGSVGDWHVPCAGRGGSAWGRGAVWLTDGWCSGCRVVLVETSKGKSKHKSIDPLNIELKINGKKYKVTEL